MRAKKRVLYTEHILVQREQNIKPIKYSFGSILYIKKDINVTNLFSILLSRLGFILCMYTYTIFNVRIHVQCTHSHTATHKHIHTERLFMTALYYDGHFLLIGSKPFPFSYGFLVQQPRSRAHMYEWIGVCMWFSVDSCEMDSVGPYSIKNHKKIYLYRPYATYYICKLHI